MSDTPDRSPLMLAGAACLLAAPLLEIVGILVTPTVSDDAGPIVSALTDHHGAFVAGVTAQTIALFLLIAGTVWLARALAPRSRGLAAAGGVVGVAGLLAIVFANGMQAAAPSLVSALGPAQATAAVHAIGSSAGVSILEPLSILGIVGYVLLAAGLRRSGSGPLWAAVGLAAGTLVETVGFATSSRAAIAIGFAVLFVGAAGAARGLLGRVSAASHGLQPAGVSS